MEGARIINNNHTRLSDELFVGMLLLSEIVDRTPNLEYILIEVDTTKPEGVPRLLTVDRDQNMPMVNCQALDKLNGNLEFQKYQWKEVVEKLDNDDEEYEAWQAECEAWQCPLQYRSQSGEFKHR